MASIQGLLAESSREIVLTGTEIGAYNCNGINLEGLINRILAEIAGDTSARFRISSSSPTISPPPARALE